MRSPWQWPPWSSRLFPSLLSSTCTNCHPSVNQSKLYFLFNSFQLREGVNWKKKFSFGHCPNYLTPPPWPQFGQLGPLFSEVEIQDLKVSLELRILYILYNILYICNLKTVKSSIHWHFWRNRLFLLTKNALLENVFFSIDLFPKMIVWSDAIIHPYMISFDLIWR